MNITSSNRKIEKILEVRNGSAIAIGNFDGFHLGHKKIIDTLKTIANQKNLASVIVTFTPNPKLFFGREQYLISTDEQKKELLEKQGVDYLSIIDFPSVVDMTDEDFLVNFLIRKFHMKHIVMGENFRFGKGREGDISFLKAASERFDFQFSVVKSVMLGDTRISSTTVRRLLADADLECANRMLGRTYVVEGTVTEGKKVGRQLGFPTINVFTNNTLLPEGVFKTSVEVDGQIHNSITYVGCCPTYNGKEKKVESHIFDFESNVYGKHVKIFFEKKLRDDIKFDTEKGLIKQIRKDIENLNVDKGCFF
jgi:riboflavin kinase / FMN adenylyltransferase